MGSVGSETGSTQGPGQRAWVGLGPAHSAAPEGRARRRRQRLGHRLVLVKMV